MSILAVRSDKGGVGRTTLAALFADAMTRRGFAVTVMDLDPQDTLRMHFGIVDPQPELAAAQKVVRAEIRPGLSRVTNSPVDLALRLGAGRQAEAMAQQRFARWAMARDLLILDTAVSDPLSMRALNGVPHLELAVFTPDAASLSMLRPDLSGETAYLLNQVDHRRPLSESALAFMREATGEMFLGAVRRDEAVPEALASLKLLSEYAPESVACRDVEVLGEHLEARLETLVRELRRAEPLRGYGT